MKNNITKIIFIISLIFFNSCQNEDNFQEEITVPEPIEFVKVEDGRLHFSDKAFLNRKVEEFKDRGQSYVADELSKFYDKEFHSLRPIIDKEDETLMQRFASRKSKLLLSARTSTEIDNDLEGLIGDDEFASLINDKGEIQVADSIYKYTSIGLFFVHKSDLEYLNKYLANNTEKVDNSKSPMSYRLSSSYRGDFCQYALREGGIKNIDNRIMRYVKPIYNCNSGSAVLSKKRELSSSSFATHAISGIGSFSEGSESSYSNNSVLNGLDDFVENLPECESRRGTFDWIFGPSRICIDKFDGSRRVKTKYWNQSYLLYKSIGINVKHQKRSWYGIWWTRSTDEIALGIKQAYFEYSIPVPQITNVTPVIFIYNGRAYNSQAQYISSTYGNSLPNLPFSAPLEIFVNLPFYGIFERNLSADRINRYFWENVWGKAKSVLQSLGQPMPKEIALVGVTSQKVVVNYVNTSRRRTNYKKIEKVFDWQASFGIKLGTGNSGGFTFQGLQMPNFYEYDKIKIDIYGAARKGSTWKGSRLVYEN